MPVKFLENHQPPSEPVMPVGLAPTVTQHELSDPSTVVNLAHDLQRQGYTLTAVWANDERFRPDTGRFVMRYLLAHRTQDQFALLVYPLPDRETVYPSLRHIFAGAIPFEQHTYDLFGLQADAMDPNEEGGSLLHERYPAEFWPLRRDQTQQALRARVYQHDGGAAEPADYLRAYFSQVSDPKKEAPANWLFYQEGDMLLTVGPIHAGVIPPGLFHFYTSDDQIRDLQVRLGFTHKGTAKLFEQLENLDHGIELAESVAGDAAFSHAMAYCEAWENLAHHNAPFPAILVRALLLEVERIANHMGNCAAIVADVGAHVPAAIMKTCRERILGNPHYDAKGEGICFTYFGHRLLMGLNRVGGLVLPDTFYKPACAENVVRRLREVVHDFLDVAESLRANRGFRRRTHDIGRTALADAVQLGAVGLVARAAGLNADYRLSRPTGVYADPDVRHILETTRKQYTAWFGAEDAVHGDVLARYIQRMVDVASSLYIVEHLAEKWKESDWLPEDLYEPCATTTITAFAHGLGYVESWRGPIVYWVMKSDEHAQPIYRCQFFDPSVLNWPVLSATLVPHETDDVQYRTFITDFPVINASFNLSYSGNDG